MSTERGEPASEPTQVKCDTVMVFDDHIGFALLFVFQLADTQHPAVDSAGE